MEKQSLNEWQRITENLKQAIAQSGKSKTQIAKETGIAKATLSQYLSGRAYPSLVTLKKLCVVLDCTTEDILGT